MILRFVFFFFLILCFKRLRVYVYVEVDFGLFFLNFSRIFWNFVVCYFKGGGVKDDFVYCDLVVKVRVIIGFFSC